MAATDASAQYTGVVSVDSVDAQPGTKIAVPVRLKNNNDEIAALTVPLKWQGTSLFLDSISYEGSLLGPDYTAQDTIDNSLQGCVFRYLPPFEDPSGFTDSEGILATLFFTVPSISLTGSQVIDSVNLDSTVVIGGIEFHLDLRIDFADPQGVNLLPDYEPGQVYVKTATDVGDDNSDILPDQFALAQNFPNPFNPTTTIEFSVPRTSPVKLEVFNVLGQLVAMPANGRYSAGVHSVQFDASGLPSGIYFYRLTHAEGSETKKMALVK